MARKFKALAAELDSTAWLAVGLYATVVVAAAVIYVWSKT